MLNQLSLLVAVVNICSPSALVDAANNGICLENPALGSRLLAIVETPSSMRNNSNTKKKNNVLAVPNSIFFFQLSVDLDEDFLSGMCGASWCLMRRELQLRAFPGELVPLTV